MSEAPRPLDRDRLKAMAKNPGERYDMAQDLADDLQRFLDDKPIHAKRPGSWLKLRKWIRRWLVERW